MISISYDLRAHRVEVDGEAIVGISRGRAFALPGLTSPAPDTSVLYEEAASALSGAKVVWDLGSGSGVGARALAEAFEKVVAIEPDPGARALSAKVAPKATVIEAYEEQGAPDAAVLVDVLGHVVSPYAVLRGLRSRCKQGTRVFVAEPLAHPLQTLKAPARRAFSRLAIKTLATSAGFAVCSWVTFEGTFLACVLTAVDDAGPALLERAAIALQSGDEASALAAYAEAQADANKGIRREAMLGEADLRLARGEGDLACAAYMRARATDGADVRPLAALSQIACDLGELESALRMAQQASSVDPADASAAVALALALAATGEHEAAWCAWRKASSLLPDHAVVASRYASAALAHGDTTSALIALERSRSYGDPWPAEAHLALSEVLLALGRKQDARAEQELAAAKSRR